jgi:formylglycine-generating enzyme required for sulfatase activity
VLPRLRELWGQPAQPQRRRERGRVGLALLPVDAPVVKGWLYAWMLEADDPAEMLLLRDAMRPFGAELAPALWVKVEARETSGPERFRALVALAAFDGGGPGWRKAGPQAVAQLLAANPLHLGLWTKALRPVADALVGPLAEVFRQHPQADRRVMAATVLADYAAGRADVLADLAADANPEQYAVLRPLLHKHRALVLGLLEKELSREAPPEDRVTARDALARRQAQAAVALVQLGRGEAVWPLLRHSPDPSRRSYLLHGLAMLGTDPVALLRRLDAEPDLSARRALLLALGGYAEAQLPARERAALVAGLLRDYRDHPDPGLHGAAEWLLRRWGHARELEQVAGGLRGRPAGKRDWYVNRQGQTLAVVRGPVEFLMGSPASEPDRMDIEALHRRRIPRSFAIATKAVTVAQFQRFLKDRPEVKHAYAKKFSPEPDGPIIGVTWFEAAQYCNWLSEQEGIPESQWCYPKEVHEGMRLPADYLHRTGYRLPTEAEWEYACRAGAVTSRYYGASAALLGEYAWYFDNTRGERTRPVGQLKPNDLGLFDMHGNVWTWCQDRLQIYPTAFGGPVSDDREGELGDTQDIHTRATRGGSFRFFAWLVRSAQRNDLRPTMRGDNVGLRLARTSD